MIKSIYLLLTILLFSPLLIFTQTKQNSMQRISLEIAIEKAIENSIPMKKQLYDYELIDIQTKTLFLGLLPSLSIGWQYNNNIELNYPDNKQSNLALKISQPLFDGGYLINKTLNNKNQLEYKKQSRDNSKEQIRSIVTQKYYQLQLIQKELSFRKNQKKSWNKMLLIAEEKFNQKLIRKIDLQQILLNQKKLESEYDLALNQLRIEVANFALLTDIEIENATNIELTTEASLSDLNIKNKINQIIHFAKQNSFKSKELLYKKKSNKIGKNSLYCSLLPKISYEATINETVTNGYKYTPPVEHSFGIHMKLPGFSNSSKIAYSSDPTLKSTSAISSSDSSISNYGLISDLISLNKESVWINKEISLYQVELENQIINLVNQIEIYKNQLEIKNDYHNLEKNEIEITTLQYENGEIPLYRLNSLVSEHHSGFLEINRMKMALFGLIDKLTQLSGITKESLYEF